MHLEWKEKYKIEYSLTYVAEDKILGIIGPSIHPFNIFINGYAAVLTFRIGRPKSAEFKVYVAIAGKKIHRGI